MSADAPAMSAGDWAGWEAFADSCELRRFCHGAAFGPADLRAMRRDMRTVREAAAQKVGWGRAGDPACKVGSADWDGAVVRLMVQLSSLLDSGLLDEALGRGVGDGEGAACEGRVPEVPAQG